MSFTDYYFVPAVLLLSVVYYKLPMSVQWVALLFSSLIFYVSWGFAGCGYLLAEVLIAWLAAVWIENSRQKISESGQSTRKSLAGVILWLSVLFLAGLLAVVKLKNVFSFLPYSFIMPLGISYYTLSLIGYIVDVYWGIDEAEKNPLRLLLFAAYFPKILEGPISSHRVIAGQLREGRKFDYQKYCFGLQRMLWGYVQKLVIADRLYLFTGTVFENYTAYNGGVLLIAYVLYAFELYCDFAGCMNIALGISEAFGITLEENFETPFFSESSAQFWRCWHITLGAWAKNYIFMPIGHTAVMRKTAERIRKFYTQKTVPDGEDVAKILKEHKRKGKRASALFLNVVPTAVVWIVIGLWHATGWNYILWGIYWGGIIIASSFLEPQYEKFTKVLHIDRENAGWKAFCRIRTFFLFVISLIISVPSTLKETVTVLKQIVFSFAPWELVNGTLLQQGLGWPNFIIAVSMIVVLMFIEHGQYEGIVYREKIASLSIVPRWVIYFGGIFLVLIFGIYGPGYDAASFVYMGY